MTFHSIPGQLIAFISILATNKPGDLVPYLPNDAGEKSITNLDKLRHSNGEISTADLRLEMQRTMQKHAAVFRTGTLLKVINYHP